MGTRIQTLVIFSFLLISPAISIHPHASIKSWCNQTPNSQTCEYFLTINPKYHVPIKAKSDFVKLSSQLALDHCMHARNNMRSLNLTPRDERERLAWADCIELYDETIRRINKTIDPTCSPADVQTWLSAALTNLETCKLGFQDFGINYHVLPLMFNNVSLLLSNTLALNKDASNYETSYEKGFPSWVGPSDRRLLRRSASASKADVVVAQDGSGDFETVSAAIEAAGRRSGSGRYVIHVKEGIYEENVDIGSDYSNIVLLGDGIGRTIITGSRSVVDGDTTYKSATFAVVGDGFIARGITFRNTAGARNHQAVALRSGSDLSVFYQCSFEGYQDTLYVHSQRQFYRQCDIYGTVDLIFGNAAVVFQNCNIYPRNPPKRTNTITAQGRTDPSQNTGISIHNCRVTAAPDLRPVQGSVRTYLGRPWQRYSRTVFMRSFLDGLVNPAGWMPWTGNFALDTLYYGEYLNTGGGSGTANRVSWRGYRVITSASEATRFAPGNFIAANSWIPATNVPFTSGL
ncbi:hypothetical protein ACS0TY_020098 [Phlomoides rotata]